jgi:hypothetical protein
MSLFTVWKEREGRMIPEDRIGWDERGQARNICGEEDCMICMWD